MFTRMIVVVFAATMLIRAQAPTLKISTPADGSKVSVRPVVSGHVPDVQARVWVIVHPEEVSEFWVQPPVTVNSDGSWRVQIHVGRAGAEDKGKAFEIRAVSGRNLKFSAGQRLTDWPEAPMRSDAVRVTRE